MNRRKLTAIILTFAMALAVMLSGCGSKNAGGAAEPAEGNAAKNEDEETVVTANTKEDVKKLAEDFYAPIQKAGPVFMTFYSDGELQSEFKRSGDTFSSSSPDMDFPYYGFIEDGVKYMIYDGETAYADEDMYDMTADSVKMMLDIFILGYYDADDDSALQFSATRTDKAGTSKLVTVVTGEDDGQAATITATGTAENGTVSDIICQMESGEEKGTYEIKFAYDNISVELPAYTIGEDYSGGGVAIEGTHVESPIQTLGELIATLREDEDLFCMMEDGHAYAIGEMGGRQYQFSAALSAEDQNALDALDIFSDTYDQDRKAILGKLVVDDCIDFTDVLVPQSELDTFVGKTVKDMVDTGYEMTGWGISEETAEVTFEKDYMDYTAQIILADGFDPDSEFEGEDLYGFTVKEISFCEPEYVALPIR